MSDLQERLEKKAEAETIQLDPGDYLEGVVFDAEYTDGLGGYDGRTPILYLDTEDGPVRFFAMHLTVKGAVVSNAPQGGDTIGISRGPDGGEEPNTYRVYHVAVERGDESERRYVFDWSIPILSDIEKHEAKRASGSDDMPF